MLFKFDLIFSKFEEKLSFFISIEIKMIRTGKIIKNKFFNSIYSLIIVSSLLVFKLIMNIQKDKINK